jgi:hypothetical protein
MTEAAIGQVDVVPGGRVLSYTRTVMVIDLLGLVIVALGPALVPGSTARYFAWTIAAPTVAGMIGAGYAAALPSLLWALTIKEWLRVRTLVVAGLALTSLILFFTLRDISLFHLLKGPGTAIFVGWVWLVAYISLPPLNIVALILQERARRETREPEPWPILPATRIAFVFWGAALAVIGALLLFSFGTMRSVWPFGLTRLGAGALGQWLLTAAVAMAWSAREKDWWRIRLLAPFFPLFFGLILVQSARTSGDFVGGAKTLVFIVVAVVSALVFGVLMASEEARYRSRSATDEQHAPDGTPQFTL